MVCHNADEVIEELLNDFLIDIKLVWKHQWETTILSLIVFIYCIINVIKKNPNWTGSYIDSPEKNKKTTINPINKIDTKCFRCTVTIMNNWKKYRKNIKY